MKDSIHLITIDPQRDFCEKGMALYVEGADEDTKRLTKSVRKNLRRLDMIHVTMDSHQSLHIAHPIMWVDKRGRRPDIYRNILHDEVVAREFTTTNPKWHDYAVYYTGELKKHGRYDLTIWPPHCIIGSPGHGFVPEFSQALIEWETETFNKVDIVAKGSNILTEHYSAVQADVPDDKDDTTKLNTALCDTLAKADLILITGQALSHCVANTITDVANYFGDDNIKKFVLLEDTSSNVPIAADKGRAFVKAMVARGMRVCKSTDW